MLVEADSDSRPLLRGVEGASGGGVLSCAAKRFFVNSFAVTPIYFDARDPSVIFALDAADNSADDDMAETERPRATAEGFLVSLPRGTKSPERGGQAKYCVLLISRYRVSSLEKVRHERRSRLTL